ncbi:cytochrome P450 [Dichotomopilus funicola]|uniref:Cytochrome P450 n=1 Tax=Dichotomopilus funicola TaxID=1934379 RepID=A0AAN6ZQ53_9PEZI|nr:cytochrome P450 [Dichotomopilus funicola]
MAILTISTAATSVAILVILRLVFQAVQRRYFHPLRVIPGPWANSISELPAAFNLVTGNQHVYYRSLHERYGPVVRVSPNEVGFVSLEAREEIYGFRKAGLMEKSPIFLGAVGNVDGQTGVSLALNKEHTRQRRALGSMFTNSALANLEDLAQVQVHKFISKLKVMADEGQTVDVADWYTYIAFDIMGELCFAEPFGCLDQASATEWSTSVINVFVAATWTQGIRRISGVGTYLESLLTRLLVPRQAAAWRTIHLTNAREKTIKRLRAADDPSRADHRDFIYQILNSSSSTKSLPLSETEIILNIALFISAGSDTTATALTGWTYFVCTHHAVYERLVREVREACPSAASDVVWSTVKDLRFLEATLLEALRLFPPSPASQQRMVPRGGAVIDGYSLPEGTTVAVSPWSSTRSKLNFHDPDSFRPERWLAVDEGGQEQFASDRLGASLPFGTGPRVCIGKNLAHMEMRLIAAHMLRNFDMVLEEKGDAGRANGVWGLDGNMKTMPVFHSMTKPPLWVRLTPVKG